MHAKFILAISILSGLLVSARVTPDDQQGVQFYYEERGYAPLARRDVLGSDGAIGPKQLVGTTEDTDYDADDELVDPETSNYVYSPSVLYGDDDDDDDSIAEADDADFDVEHFFKHFRRAIDDFAQSYAEAYHPNSGLFRRDDLSLEDDYEEGFSDLEKRLSLGSLGSSLTKGLGSLVKKKPKLKTPKISNPFSSKNKVKESGGKNDDGSPNFGGGRPQKKQSGSGSGGGSSAGGKGSGRSPVAGPNGKAGTAGNAGGNGQPHAGNPGGLQRGGAVRGSGGSEEAARRAANRRKYPHADPDTAGDLRNQGIHVDSDGRTWKDVKRALEVDVAE